MLQFNLFYFLCLLYLYFIFLYLYFVFLYLYFIFIYLCFIFLYLYDILTITPIFYFISTINCLFTLSRYIIQGSIYIKFLIIEMNLY
jgi:hypothetical protein